MRDKNKCMILKKDSCTSIKPQQHQKFAAKTCLVIDLFSFFKKAKSSFQIHPFFIYNNLKVFSFSFFIRSFFIRQFYNTTHAMHSSYQKSVLGTSQLGPSCSTIAFNGEPIPNFGTSISKIYQKIIQISKNTTNAL